MFLEAVDQNPFLWFSQKLFDYCSQSFTIGVFLLRKCILFMALSSVLYEIWSKIKSELLSRESQMEYTWYSHHITHFFFGFIGLPLGHSNALAKSFEFDTVPITLK